MEVPIASFRKIYAWDQARRSGILSDAMMIKVQWEITKVHVALFRKTMLLSPMGPF